MPDIKWGGSGIEKVVFDYFVDNFPKGSVVLELGGGNVSTIAFSTMYKVYSVEDNNKFLKHTSYTTYIYAPVKDGWYDIDILVKEMPEDYDVVFVDGPYGVGNRKGILNHYSIFKNVPFIFHDTDRKEEKETSIKLAEILQKKVVHYNEGEPKDFWSVIEK